MSSSITVKLGKKKSTTQKRVKATITVKANGAARPTGKVTIKVGKRTFTKTLKAKNNGKLTVTLPKLKKGTYKVTAKYSGNTAIKAATTKKTVKLKVTKAKKK